MICKLCSFILINRMADIGVGPLHSHLARFRRDSGLVLRAQLDVKLCGMLSLCPPKDWVLLRTSTQSSNSTFPLASTLTCLRVSRATSYDWPLDWRAWRTADLSTRPGVSVFSELNRDQLRKLEISRFTHLKRFTRSNISSRDTSGNFFCSLKASMAKNKNIRWW